MQPGDSFASSHHHHHDYHTHLASESLRLVSISQGMSNWVLITMLETPSTSPSLCLQRTLTHKGLGSLQLGYGDQAAVSSRGAVSRSSLEPAGARGDDRMQPGFRTRFLRTPSPAAVLPAAECVRKMPSYLSLVDLKIRWSHA